MDWQRIADEVLGEGIIVNDLRDLPVTAMVDMMRYAAQAYPDEYAKWAEEQEQEQDIEDTG